MGRFSWAESRIGVANPPSRPSTAMNSDSCRIDSITAVSVTSASRPKAGCAGDQVPLRMRRKECREEDRDRSAVHRVREERVLARGLAIANHQQRDRHQDADDHAHRRLKPALIDRIAEEEDAGEDESDARHRREQAHADKLLEIETPGRRTRCLGCVRCLGCLRGGCLGCLRGGCLGCLRARVA